MDKGPPEALPFVILPVPLHLPPLPSIAMGTHPLTSPASCFSPVGEERGRISSECVLSGAASL